MDVRWHRQWRGAALLALALGAFAATSAPLRADTERDVQQTALARQVLFEDPELAALNLGVRVRNRIATLYGPVPSPGHSLKAERALRNLFELVDVENELEINDTGELERELLPALRTPAFLPDQLPPALPQMPSRRAGDPVAPRGVPAPVPVKAAPAPRVSSFDDVELPAIDLPARMPKGPEQR
jgi:hypothetical protein